MFYKTPFLDSLNDDKKILKDKISNILNHITHLLETDNIDDSLFTITCIENILASKTNKFTKKDKNLIATTLDELIKSFTVFQKYRNYKKVSIF